MAALRQFLPEGYTDGIAQKLDLVAWSYRDIAVQDEMGMKAVMRLLDLDGAGYRDRVPAHDAAPVKKRRNAANGYAIVGPARQFEYRGGLDTGLCPLIGQAIENRADKPLALAQLWQFASCRRVEYPDMATIDAGAISQVDETKLPRLKRCRAARDVNRRLRRQMLLVLDGPHADHRGHDKQGRADQSRFGKWPIIQ
jgi:hypothetical protein